MSKKDRDEQLEEILQNTKPTAEQYVAEGQNSGSTTPTEPSDAAPLLEQEACADDLTDCEAERGIPEAEAEVPKADSEVETAVQAEEKLDLTEVKKPKKKKRKKFSYVDVLQDLFPWKGDRAIQVVRKVVFLISITVFGVCLHLLSSYYLGLRGSQEEYREIQGLVSEIDLTAPTESDDIQISDEEYLMLNDIGNKLLPLNPDTIGYITIPDTPVDYPVVQCEDNDKYLHLSFYGEPYDNGTVFLDYRNVLDQVEDGRRVLENSQNLVIYGHDMRDESMFGSLKYYRNNYDYYDQHPIITFRSNYKTYLYKIYGVFLLDAIDETETKFDCWNKLNFENETEFYEFTNNVKRRSVVNTNVDVKYGDQLLTLFTCNTAFAKARLIVTARMVRPGEDLYEGTTDSTRNDNVLWPTIYYRWNKNYYDPDAEFIPYGPLS